MDESEKHLDFDTDLPEDDFDLDDVNLQVIARLKVYAQAQGDEEALRWLDDCAAFCAAMNAPADGHYSLL